MIGRVKNHRGVRGILAVISAALSLMLLVHLTTCLPCYDDDVCASARIDTTLHTVFDKPADIMGAAGKGAGAAALPDYIQTFVVLLNVFAALETVDSIALDATHAYVDGNSALAHRRTVVLLV